MKFYHKCKIKDFITQNWKDLVLVFITPMILFLLFLLPLDIKEMLVLNRDYPKIYTIFTANFIHEGFDHLKYNIINYILSIFLLYFSVSKINKKYIFGRLLLVNLTLVPISISLIWMSVNKFIWTGVEKTLGFSGIVSSINGAVVYSYIIFLNERVKINKLYATLSSISFSMFILILIYFEFYTRMLIGLIISAIVVFIMAEKTLKTIDKKTEMKLIKNSKSSIKVRLYLPILYVIVIFFSFQLFPKNFAQGNVLTNFFIHYLGFIIGIATFFVLNEKYK
ncbi:MAG: hypothetical protein QW631_00490 [Candidatus Aenigmatarchaeota archaeon]